MYYISLTFIFSFVVINLIILLNVVIAMMTDTYAHTTSFRQGLHNYTIMSTAPSYRIDKFYGGLILLPPPFAVFGTLTLPYYFCVKDKAKL